MIVHVAEVNEEICVMAFDLEEENLFVELDKQFLERLVGQPIVGGEFFNLGVSADGFSISSKQVEMSL